MVFMSVLIVVLVQYWLHFSNEVISKNWLREAFRCLLSHTQSPNAGSGFSGALQSIIIPVLMVGFIFWVVQAIFGWFGYFVLSVVWLWYLMDVTHIHKKKSDAGDALWIETYQHIFSKIFWFSLFGPVGVALQFFAEFEHQDLMANDTHSPVATAISQILAVLNWVPVRLLGITYALVGHFAPTFKLWQENLSSGLVDASQLVSLFGNTAQDDQSHEAVSATVIRAVWVWLVVLALVSIGMLL